MVLKQRQIAAETLRVLDNVVNSARGGYAEDDHNYQRGRHNYALYKVGGACRKEPAYARVQYDYARAYYHCKMIVPPEQLLKKLSASREARRGVRYEKHQYYHRRDAEDNVLPLAVAFREEVRKRYRVYPVRVHAQPLRYEQPVEVCSDRKSYRCPAYLRAAAEIRKSRKSHEQVAAHIGSFRAHCRYYGSKLSAAEIKVSDIVVLLREYHADNYHKQQIDHYRYYYYCHDCFLSLYPVNPCRTGGDCDPAVFYAGSFAGLVQRPGQLTVIRERDFPVRRVQHCQKRFTAV